MTETKTAWLELLGSGVRERFVDAGGVRTRVLEAGDGPQTLVLLHGTGGHAEAYARNIAPLSSHFRVVVPDLVGHGLTGRPSDLAYTIDDFADHLAALLDALELERVHVSGESLGGVVGAWLAITRPERVDRLVMNTAVLARPDRIEELMELAKRTAAIMQNGLTRDAVRQRMEWLVADPSQMPDEMVEIRYRMYSQPGMLETVGRVMASVAGTFAGPLGDKYLAPGLMAKIEAPTMVLWTEHNPGQSVELARERAGELVDGRFELLSDCGHWPQFEQPERFDALHVDFLA